MEQKEAEDDKKEKRRMGWPPYLIGGGCASKAPLTSCVFPGDRIIGTASPTENAFLVLLSHLILWSANTKIMRFQSQ